MNAKLSESATGQQKRKPTREERDAAYSSGAGRKAVEHDLPERDPKDAPKISRLKHSQAPVGLDLETRADAYTDEKRTP